jgi:hypothetical protein
MHIVRQSPQELVVVDSSRWISVLCALAGAAIIWAAIAKHQPRGILGAGLFLLFAFLADSRTIFTFDAIGRVVSWSGRRLFTTESGAIPFAQVVDVTVEAISGHGGPAYRLAILTAEGSTPMAYGYRGMGNIRQLRATIRAVVRPETIAGTTPERPLGDEASIRSLLRQGRRIDAIHLLQSSENIKLSQAAARVDALDQARR